ncbi:hypothetical protein C0J52_26212 [Blattella germanica]|nr:hypothetical protein C0J52_26212 [Blattella germanica]
MTWFSGLLSNFRVKSGRSVGLNLKMNLNHYGYEPGTRSYGRRDDCSTPARSNSESPSYVDPAEVESTSRLAPNPELWNPRAYGQEYPDTLPSHEGIPENYHCYNDDYSV